jgi:hypothetical protein
MKMATALLSLLHALLASFSAYTLYLSSIAIRHLQKYESTSKTAAKYSNTAEYQLHKTRTTQASGALSVPSPFPPSSSPSLPSLLLTDNKYLLGPPILPLFYLPGDISVFLW